MVLGSRSMSTRRAFFLVVAVALLCGASAMRAQQAAPPAAPAAPAADPFKFSADHVLMMLQAKPEKAADFESAWSAIKDKLSKSDKPDYKALGDSLNYFKVTGMPAGSPNLYVFDLNPPSKTLSYDPGKILFDAGTPFERKDADEIYKKISEAFAGANFLTLSKVGS